ncbi:MAG: hypothetical protein RLT05_32240, partial [Bauldia litoralis]
VGYVVGDELFVDLLDRIDDRLWCCEDLGAGLLGIFFTCVDKNSAEAFARMAGSAWDRMNDAGEEDAKKAGTKVLTAPKPVVDSVKEINKEFIANYIADAKKRGIDGEAVLKFYHSELAKLQGK